MEPKKSSAQHQPHAMEPKKSSPRGAGAAAAAATEAESPLSSLFYPPAPAANAKDQDLYSILYKGQSGSAQAGVTDKGNLYFWLQSSSHEDYIRPNYYIGYLVKQMVNHNGLLPKAVRRMERMVNIRRLMIQLILRVLDHLCIMVVENISMAALQPRKQQNHPLITKGTGKIQPQIPMETGGKARFITKRTWWPLLREQGTEGGGSEARFP